MSILSTLWNCGQNKNDSLKEITEITNKEDDFADVSLNILSKTHDENYTSFVAKGVCNHKVVGLEVLLANDIEPGVINGQISQNGFRKNGLILKSIGKESDEFLSALSKLYSLNNQNKFKKNEISATVFSLNSEKLNSNNSSYYKFKIFLNDESNEDDYAELYINLNFQNQELEIFEKDNEYRKAIIKALSE